MNRTSRLALVACCVLTGVSVALIWGLHESQARLAEAERRIDELSAQVGSRAAADRDAPQTAAVPAVASTTPVQVLAPARGISDAPVFADDSAPASLQSPTQRKLRDAQSRENARAMYSDFAAEQGLSAADAEILYELFGAQRDQATNPSDADALIASRLGGALVQPLRQYRESLPARIEVSRFASHLQSLGKPLSAAQRMEIGRAISRDQRDHGGPAFSDGQGPQEMANVYADWRQAQQLRVDLLVRDLLTPEQMQLQDDLRESSAVTQ